MLAIHSEVHSAVHHAARSTGWRSSEHPARARIDVKPNGHGINGEPAAGGLNRGQVFSSASARALLGDARNVACLQVIRASNRVNGPRAVPQVDDLHRASTAVAVGRTLILYNRASDPCAPFTILPVREVNAALAAALGSFIAVAPAAADAG